MPIAARGPGRTKLRNAIFENHLTQRVVAKRIGILEGRLSNIIHGHTDPTRDEKRALSVLLGVSVKTLFGADADEE